MRSLSTLVTVLALLVYAPFRAILAGEPSGKVLLTVSLQERFGVAQPDQIVDFDIGMPLDPRTTCLCGPDDQEAPYQLLENGKKIALRTALPANAQKTWKVLSGRAPAPYADGVKVAEQDGGIEITNGLTGVRLPLAAQAIQPDGKTVLAPIQALRLRDGTWTAKGPNVLHIPGTVKKVEVRFLEKGPLKALAEVAYDVDRPELRYGQTVIAKAGPGRYCSRVEILAGQPAVLFEEDTDTQFGYSVALREVKATQARYRGHHSNKKEHGYESDGRAYRAWHERAGCDAFFDLPFDRDYGSSYITNLDQWPSIRWLAVWDPWVFDSGWYWQVYDKEGGPESNLFGLFAGRASRAVGAGFSGVGLQTKSAKSGGPCVGLTIQTNHRGADASLNPKMRFQWGFFVGTKGPDLLPPDQVQPIARQMNLRAGINLNKIQHLTLDFPDPPKGYGSLYMDSGVVKRMIEKLRQDTLGKHGKGYYGYLYGAEPSARELVDAWADAKGEKLKDAVKQLEETARSLLQGFVQEDGIYTMRCHYWHGGLEMSRKLLWIDQVLASDKASADDKAKAKAAAVLFAAILWDDDFVPLSVPAGVNLGTANMPVQQANYREMYALYLAQHPLMKEHVASVWENARQMLHGTVNEYGAHMGSVHYVGASNGPLLSTFQQLKMAGVADPFKSDERIARFAEFYMNFLTPPEPRFGNVRKLIAVGDGSTEGTEAYGQMATGFADLNPDLSARLMGAWQEDGKVHTGFHGSTLLKINEDLPAKPPALSHANFPGWYSVLRCGWGTPHETAVWFVNGEWYRDHRHADHGSLVIYALGAPLSVDWGPIYYPQVPGHFMHSGVLPEAKIGHPWDKENPPLNAGGGWNNSKQESFATAAGGARSVATFQMGKLQWTRAVTLVHANDRPPAILIDDAFSGVGAGEPKVFTLNLMAEGSVVTPAGNVTPPPRTHNNNDKKELPSASQVFTLAPGVRTLSFTGQSWKAHPTQGVDWDVVVIAAEEQQCQIGNWAHTWHPGNETGAFQRANGRGFEERQHILRIRGKGGFKVLILPCRKGERPPGLKVETEGEAVKITLGGQTTILAKESYTHAGKNVRFEAPADGK
ncbi:MAG: hypothetical protein NTW87_17620 [Planctomycetota bacterium]|nr:hypothetical protein [Planctomycetota bacterium]